MWLEVLCWIDHVWSSKECVCFACDTRVRLDATSICFVWGFVCLKLYPHLRVSELDDRCSSPVVVSVCNCAYYVVS